VSRLILALLIVIAFMLGWTARTLAFSASRPAPVIPAAPSGTSEPDRELAEAPRALVAPHVPAPTATSAPRHGLSGIATWYATGPDGLYAAAGPALRQALGPGWRGRSVTVCRSTCIRVKLVDWCACSGTRVVDLSDEAFRALGPLSRGLLRVEVQLGG